MSDADNTPHLQALAALIQRRHLDTAARMILDIITPVAFLASQLALFVEPLTPRGRWQQYVDLLCEETNWARLRVLLDEHEC